MSDRVEALLERVRTTFEQRAPFAEDRELGPDLVAQARPMVRAFVAGFAVGGETTWDETSEAYSLLNLLGRHLGESGLTPGAAMIGCDLLLFELSRELELSADVERGLTFRGVFIEGYVGGVQSQAAREQQAALEKTQAQFVTASGTSVLMLTGPLFAETVERIAEEFGRILFRQDAKRAVVDLQALCAGSFSRDVLEAVLGIDEQARTLGCRCVFAGITRTRAHEVLGSSAQLAHIEFIDSLDGVFDDTGAYANDSTRLRSALRRVDRWLVEHKRPKEK